MGEGQGEQGGAGGGRVLDRGVREGSEEQSVQDLESDVVGELLSAAGAGGGNTETAWRRAPGFWGCRLWRTGSRRRWWPRGWRRRSNRSSTPDSYGYRPRRSALDAVEACRQRCWKTDWVIDLDIQKFFDSVPLGSRRQSGGGEHRSPVGGAVCEAVAASAGAAARRDVCRSGTAEPRKGRRSRPCWRICSCTTRSTRGWPGNSRRHVRTLRG